MLKTVCWLFLCAFCFAIVLPQNVCGQSEKSTVPTSKDSTVFKNQIGFVVKLNSYETISNLPIEFTFKRVLSNRMLFRLGAGLHISDGIADGYSPNNNNNPISNAKGGTNGFNISSGIEKQFLLFLPRLTMSLGCDFRYLRYVRNVESSYKDSLNNGMTTTENNSGNEIKLVAFAELQYRLSNRFSLCVQTSANLGISISNSRSEGYSTSQGKNQYYPATTSESIGWYSYVTPVRNFSLFYHF